MTHNEGRKPTQRTTERCKMNVTAFKKPFTELIKVVTKY